MLAISRFARSLGRRYASFGVALAFVSSVAGGALAAAPPDEPEKQELFRAGEDGYVLYRIPGIVVTANGTALAYCEARKSDRSDWGTIDVMLRRSVDGGKTWSPKRALAHDGPKVAKNPVALAQKLATEADVTVNNPVAIADAKPGVVHFLYCVEYARCFYRRSADDGETFSPAVDVTATFEAFRKDYDWKVIAAGPAHGIQTKSGRLVVPVWMSLGSGDAGHRPSVVATIYSDDSGDTWHAGEIAAPNTEELVNPNETVIAELSDGRVMLNIRSESKAHRRAVTTSPDGATNWTAPRFQQELVEPICMGSLVRVPGPRGGLVFANPDTLEKSGGSPQPGRSRDRKNLTVRFSGDDGATWNAGRVLEPGLSAYSDLAVAPDGSILCLYESGSTDGSHYRTKSLTLARFPLDWVKAGRPERLPEN